MQCSKCRHENEHDAPRCSSCRSSLTLAVLEVVRGNPGEKVFFLKPRNYVIGRARHSDLALAEPSISKFHARLVYEDDRFFIEDQGSLHGVYLNATKTDRAELTPGALVQLGNVTLKFDPIGSDLTTERIAEFPWIEQQQLLLSLVQTLNSTLVLNQVLEQVLDAVMRITHAERGFLLLADAGSDAQRYATVAGLRLRVGRLRSSAAPVTEAPSISTSVVRKAIESGVTVATGNAVADPKLGTAQSVILMDLRTIVCIPLRSPRAELEGLDHASTLGALYVDNHETSAPFSPDSLRAAEALARHAALAIENAQLFEREQRTIEELRSAQKQLLQSEKLATIGQMAAGIAHELNTPLTYIMGNLELLQMGKLDDQQQDMLGSILRGAERIRGLAQNLLTFSRPVREEASLVSANDLIEKGLELCHYQIVKAGVKLEKRLGPELPAIRGVASQIEMALINLFVNAVQAMTAGGVLRVESRGQPGEVEITVSDNGHGIAEKVQPFIFEPFFTTKTEGQGTGLGLSTVLMVVERHNGRIDFTSTPGHGTTFRVVLPTA